LEEEQATLGTHFTVAEAKAKFSETIERAMSKGRRQSRERAASLPWWWEPKNGSDRRSAPATWELRGVSIARIVPEVPPAQGAPAEN
jgi:hypothetical protein